MTPAPGSPAATLFDHAFALVVGVEGGYDLTRSDRGNWTSGVVGRGVLKGTKYGISAMSYPSLDIKNLTLAAAQAIYLSDFWTPVRCDIMPPPLALLVFDAAVNEGPDFAKQNVQRAVGAFPDGDIGPETLAAIAACDPLAATTEFAARRMVGYAGDSEFSTDGLGWSRRLMTVFAAALALIGPAPAAPPAAKGPAS